MDACDAGLPKTVQDAQSVPGGYCAAAVAQEPEVLSCTQYLGDASIWVIVSKGDGDYQVEVIADQPRPNLVLHWAVDGWELPPEQAWPPGTRKVGDGGAVQSPFEFGQLVTLTFPEAGPSFLAAKRGSGGSYDLLVLRPLRLLRGLGAPSWAAYALPCVPEVVAMCPSRLVFVLRDGDQWIHNRGGDFSADLKPSSIEGKHAG
ncbi:hypothetical protein N2152v2_000800 [Parachlorella kessleri]